MTISVMTYNIRIGWGAQDRFDPSDPHKGLRRVAELIHTYDPDIVALQEVDRFRARTGHVDQAAWLAQALDRHFVHSPSYLDSPVPNGGRGRYGNALLTKEPIRWSESHHLFHRGWLLPGEAEWVRERRSMLEAATAVNGLELTVYSLHLSTTPDQQAFQIEQISATLKQIDGPQVIMGDFNTSLDFPAMRLLTDNWTSALEAVGTSQEASKTYPWGRNAELAIDHIFVSQDLKVIDAQVIVDENGASDHNPVIARLEFDK